MFLFFYIGLICSSLANIQDDFHGQSAEDYPIALGSPYCPNHVDPWDTVRDGLSDYMKSHNS